MERSRGITVEVGAGKIRKWRMIRRCAQPSIYTRGCALSVTSTHFTEKGDETLIPH